MSKCDHCNVRSQVIMLVNIGAIPHHRTKKKCKTGGPNYGQEKAKKFSIRSSRHEQFLSDIGRQATSKR